MVTDHVGAPKKKALWSSLRVRVFWISIVWISLALLATGYVLNRLFEHHVRQQYQQQLQVYADYVLAGIDLNADGVPVLDQSPQSPRFLQPLSGLYWQLNDAEGKAILRSRSLWDQQLTAPSDSLALGQSHFHLRQGPQGKDILLIELPIRFEAFPDRDWRLLVAEDADAFMKSIREWQQTLILFLSVLLVCLAIAAFAQITLGFAPLRRLQEKVQQLQAGDLARLEGEYPSEFQSLVKDFNAVLDANEQMLQRARAQAGDLAHAIKTPVTVISTALDQADSGQIKEPELIRLIREQIALLDSQVHWRLRRARIAAQSAGVPGRVCLVEPVLSQIFRVMQKLYADRGVRFELGSQVHGLKFLGESQDLAEMVGNLLDNAGKWAKSQVKVSAVFRQGYLTLEFEDDGPGIAAERRSHALQRGARMDERVPGSGLGLAIVNDLVQLYAGRLDLDASKLGGLRVSLSLPGRASPEI